MTGITQKSCIVLIYCVWPLKNNCFENVGWCKTMYVIIEVLVILNKVIVTVNNSK